MCMMLHYDSFKVESKSFFKNNMWLQQPLSKDSIPRPRQPIHSHHTPRNNTLSPSNNYNVLQTKSVIVRGFIFDYCENTTVHGMRYISERDRHWTERLLWTFLCIMAFSGTVYLSILIWDRYITSPTVSVIETTNFPISNVPFPSVTLCDYNRVHWSKALIFQKEHLPNASNETIRLFHGFLKSMAQVAFGDFDFIKQDVDYSKSPELAALNITELMLKVMPQCQEMFHGVENCWWRNNYFNCCEKFELQRTEYGYCYSFNSEVSEASTGARKWFDSSAYYLKAPERNENSKEELRPRRTSSYGPWGGLRFTLNTSHDTPPDQHITSGIIVVVNSPQKFPESGRIIPTGQAVSVDIDAYVTYTVERVRSLSLKDRGCLYIDEGNNMDLGGYVLHNCIIECHRNYTIKYCNCTPYFYYSHRDDVRSCDISGYLCLSKYNSLFNFHKADESNPYFRNSSEGMECSCEPDCSYPQYSTSMSMSPHMSGDKEKNETIFLDIHFQNQAMVRYRTDVVFGWLDLVVAFGGIAGLCLGCSLLSGVELIYYLTLRLYRHYRLVYGKSPFKFNFKQKKNMLTRVQPRSFLQLNPQSFIKASETYR